MKENCKYLHRDPDSNNVKSMADTNCELEKEHDIVDSCSKDEHNNNDTSEMVVDLGETLAFKEKTIEDLKQVQVNLKLENGNLKQQLEKLKRVTANTHNELMARK